MISLSVSVRWRWKLHDSGSDARDFTIEFLESVLHVSQVNAQVLAGRRPVVERAPLYIDDANRMLDSGSNACCDRKLLSVAQPAILKRSVHALIEMRPGVTKAAV